MNWRRGLPKSGFPGSGLFEGRSLNSSDDQSLTAPAPSNGRYPLVAEVQFEHPAVVLRVTRGDRLHAAEVVGKTAVLILFLVLGLSVAVGPDLVLEQGERAVDARVR